jgi:site-specific DNA-methyltransferase (adenine-specific)
MELYNGDCMEVMKGFENDSVDFTLTDIPYGAVNRSGDGFRNLDKGKADKITFDLEMFLNQVYRISKNNLCIFCGKEQFSEIYKYFTDKKGTVRPIIWEKSNPDPMNGQYVYLSGVEMAVWFKKRGAKTFNAHCKNSVMKHPKGRSKIHPTEKNHKLLEEIIVDNTNVGDIVFDPCMGSGSHLLVAKNLDRKYIGIELDDEYFNIAEQRIKNSY